VAAPYGSWESPITSGMVASAGISLGQVELGPGDVWWLEGRPAEQGRSVLVRYPLENGIKTDVTPAGFNVRTRVHEYGGGSFFVHGETVFFSNFADQRLYRQEAGAEPVALTGEPEIPAGDRYADGVVTGDGAWIICVRERHRTGAEPVNEIVILPADGSAEPETLVEGNDFYSFPRLSPDGRKLAWTTWNHPQMPWDGTELWVADFDGRQISGPRLVAGGTDESIFQPSFSPKGDLHFISDRSGWWNLYRCQGSGAQPEIRPLAPMDAEFGAPQWGLAMATYGFINDEDIVCIYGSGGVRRLAILDSDAGRLEDLAVDVTSFPMPNLRCCGSRVAVVAGEPSEAAALLVIDLDSGKGEVVRRSIGYDIDRDWISTAEAIEYPTDAGFSAHAFFYKPRNPGFEGPPGEHPPLIVISHGGPTAGTTTALNPQIQYWTSRGFAVVDVDYRGSTGYGRAYVQALRGEWGVADTADCINAARFLVRRGEVDPDHLSIRGGSAGGYTTLCALVFHHEFAAGASYYGVADLEALAQDTHKFESRYLDSLIGPYPAAKRLYRERSPVHFASQLSCPVIMFQGLEDRIVPPAQAEEMVKALERKGLPYAYLTFEGEQHGFRRAENLKACLESELYFYSKVFGFDLGLKVAPVEIAYLS
jgi:dipeptidyl aminopeptidase/acylaminoacyl peptidase